jgi:hypothetical protein
LSPVKELSPATQSICDQAAQSFTGGVVMKLHPHVKAQIHVAAKAVAHFALIRIFGESIAASVVKAAQLLSKAKKDQTKE